MKKIYKLLSGARKGILALTLTVSGAAYSQATYTYNFTGTVQTLTLPPGKWSIECWGANGGSITTLGGQGIGGYSIGKFQTTSQTTLSILVGGRGFPATGNTSAAGAGGWNGGGGGAAIGRSGAGGGGATDVRVGGLAATNRIIVAGGGGGAAFYGSTLSSSLVAPGGNGGDIVAQKGSVISSAGVITVGGGGAGANGATPGAANFILSNGTTSGGGGGASSGGSIGGQGTGGGAGGTAGPGGSGSTGGSAGGGGGYAGGAGGVQVGNQGVAGGGGSGYIGGVSNGTTTMFGQPAYVPSPDATGHGYVVIKELCSVQAFAAASNSLSPEICPGEFVTLSSNAVGNYSWSTGQMTSSISVSPSVNTTYTITGTGLLNCIETSTISVKVNSGPALNVSASKTLVCIGETVTLTATGADNYQWAGGPATPEYTIMATTADVYSVTGMHSLNTCTTEVSIPIGIVVPNVTFPSNTVVCAGGTVTLTASGADLYSWSGISTGNYGVFVFQPVGTTTLSLIATTQSLTTSCPLTQTFVVTVNALPTLTATAESEVTCTKQSNTLIATGAQTYTWSNGKTGDNTVVTPTVSTIYTVTGTDLNGCVGKGQVYAMVSTCTGIETLNEGKNGFELYPNPSQGTFTLKSDTPTDLLLINQLGQQVQTATLSAENGFSQQISELKPGIYFVVPTKPGTGATRKVIVQ